MKKRFIGASVAALAALSGFVAVGAAASGVTVSRFPVSFSVFNPCTNENVELSGTALTVIDTTPEDNHGLTFHSIDMALKGVGHTRLIAPGPRNDLVFAIVFHFTINANGEVVGWHNRVTAEACV